ncbi:hypothetical protein, partial [Streptomyces collinus]
MDRIFLQRVLNRSHRSGPSERISPGPIEAVDGAEGGGVLTRAHACLRRAVTAVPARGVRRGP